MREARSEEEMTRSLVHTQLHPLVHHSGGQGGSIIDTLFGERVQYFNISRVFNAYLESRKHYGMLVHSHIMGKLHIQMPRWARWLANDDGKNISHQLFNT